MRVTRGKKPSQSDLDAIEAFRKEMLLEIAERKKKTVWDGERALPAHPDATQPDHSDVPF